MPHAIDCVRLEKNVFNNTIGILLDIKRKTKDGKSRVDLVNQGIRMNLHLGQLQNRPESQPPRPKEGCVPVS
jgi:hypothetical protein